jgi:hypothetical protein
MKSPLKLPRDQVEALRPGDVRLYLTSRGWVPKRNGATDKAMEFRHPSFPGAELLLPLQREVGDFVLRMADVVVSLATIEQRPAWEVLKDVSGPPGDVFRLRVFAADAELGSLPLVEGIDLLRGGRDLLLAAACSAIRPQPLHPLKLPKEAREFLRSCRLGQTERGSFVATIITPVPPEIQSELTFMEPFSRKVSTGLMSTLGFVSDAIRTGTPGRILEGIELGVSVNLCESLEAMKPSGDHSRLEIAVTWAQNRGGIPESVPSSVSFPQESFSFIEEAGRELRIRAFAKPERYRGRLITTELIHRPFIREPVGRIVMASEVAGQPAKIKVDLAPKDFRRACDALRDGKLVAVSGIIRKEVKARVYELTEPRGFDVIEGA